MEGGSSCELEISPLRFTVHPNTAPVRTCNAPVTTPHLQVGGAHSTQQQQTDRKDLLFLVEAAELIPSLMLPLYNNTMWPPFLPQPHATMPPRAPVAKQALTYFPLAAACCPSRSSSLSHCPCGRYKKNPRLWVCLLALPLPQCTGPPRFAVPLCVLVAAPNAPRRRPEKALSRVKRKIKTAILGTPVAHLFCDPFPPAMSPSLCPLPQYPETAASSLGSWRRIRNP